MNFGNYDPLVFTCLDAIGHHQQQCFSFRTRLNPVRRSPELAHILELDHCRHEAKQGPAFVLRQR